MKNLFTIKFCQILGVCLFSAFVTANVVRAQAKFINGSDGLPLWIKDVGARTTPKPRRTFSANVYGAQANGATNSTRAIQKAIDECAQAGGGVVTLKPGSYVTGALFLKTNVELQLDTTVTL